MDILVRLLIAVIFIIVFFVIVWLYRKIEAPPAGNKQGKPVVAMADDEELVGVIAAALAAMLATSPTKIRIASVKEIDDGSAWRHYSRQRLFSRGQCWETRK